MDYAFSRFNKCSKPSRIKSNIDVLTKIINKTPFEALRGEALYNRLRYYHEKDKKEEWHSDFTQLVSNHPEHFRTAYVYDRYAPEQPIKKGEPLIYDSFNGLKEGETISLSEIKESYLLIDFWATWCGPCIESLPALKETYQEFRESDFAILSISLDENPEQVVRFRENEMAMPWYHAYEKRGSKKVREMGIVGIPYYLLLGPERKVITKDQSKLKGDSLAITLQKYLTQ
ncbi:TlpA disulfide reductase family protein [Fodinibius sp.]|uniref:TlpA family protein disulfide reductase n=1 Tax=Fodinibius sp. TaxID=1872440 RepID=UPI002ACE3001|nr:TlpA disulfide reductase family protein [Fodinibius sp.]MDZ7659491.1 TlpA disulfide reductase family protein [Fodinibius sp.]